MDTSSYLESRYDTLAEVLRELYDRIDATVELVPGRFTRYDNARNRTIGFADHAAEERISVSLSGVQWPEAADMFGMSRLQFLALLRTKESRDWLFSGGDPWEWLESESALGEGDGEDEVSPASRGEVEVKESVPDVDGDGGDDPEGFVWGSESEVLPHEGEEVDELEELALGAIWDDLEAFSVGGTGESENDLGEVLGTRDG